MPPYARLESDADMTEEAELRRLEGGESAPSNRRRRTSGGGTSAGTARDPAETASWADVLRTTANSPPQNEPAAVPLGDPSGKVLAPPAVLRTACLVEQTSQHSWRVAVGDAVAHFLAANGPPEIVNYNLHKVKGAWVCPVSVLRHPFVPSGPRFNHHDFADLLELTDLGRRELSKPEACQALVYRLELACSGRSHGLPKQARATRTMFSPLFPFLPVGVLLADFDLWEAFPPPSNRSPWRM